MVSRWPAPVLVPAFILAAVLTAFGPGVSAQAPRAVDESFFAERVYPVLHAVQCERCHSDNGVASETRLEFPEADAGHDRITAFGLSLMDLVDRQEPRAIVVAAEADEAREAHRRPADQAGQRRGEARCGAGSTTWPAFPMSRSARHESGSPGPIGAAWRRWPCVA